jgi:predicted DNA-binding transcriptional regulator AlpA
MENNVVTFQQLQMMLGVKENTVRALIKSNDFPESVLTKTGGTIHFRLDALLNWFESMEAQICC